MGKSSNKLTELSPRDKIVVVTRLFFCSDQIKVYCKSLGLRSEEFDVNFLTTLAGSEVVDALIEGLEEGLAKGVKKIMDQRMAIADTVDRWVREDVE
jgi:hypothetical protein